MCVCVFVGADDIDGVGEDDEIEMDRCMQEWDEGRTSEKAWEWDEGRTSEKGGELDERRLGEQERVTGEQ